MNVPFDDNKESGDAKPEAEGTKRKGKPAAKRKDEKAKSNEAETYTRERAALEMGQVDAKGIEKLLPPWAEFVRRIDYELVNPYTAIKRQRHEDDSVRYKKDLSKVVLNDDGEIVFSWYGRKDTKEREDEAERVKATETEAKAIRDQYVAVKDKLPKHVYATAPNAKQFAKELEVKSDGEFRGSDGCKKREVYRQVAIFSEKGRSWDKDPGNAIFIQQRIRYDDDSKSDLPWTWWSDHHWRNMEPKGAKLPLWGMERLGDGKPVMLHEGAFTAMHVRTLCDYYKRTIEGEQARKFCDDPDSMIAGNEALWERLSDFTHLGWPGGGPNYSRVDFSPLREVDVSITIACDHDRIGEKAAKGISRIIGKKVRAIVFDDDFKAGFDLADAWPDRPEWWAEEGEEDANAGEKRRRYVGPSLDHYVVSVTKATRVIETTAKGRPPTVITNEFADEWYVTESKLFIHKDRPDVILNESRFNTRVRQFSDVEDTARLMISEGSSLVLDVTYEPGKGRIVVDEEGNGRKVNTYRGSSTKPKKGDVRPFLEVMQHVIPVKEDRHHLMRWMATLIARPDIKMYYGVLLHSVAQGIGKSTLGEAVLAPLVGRHNASAPNDYDIVEGRFNGWLDRKRLAVIHEIHTDGMRGRKVYDKLKSILTEKRIEVEQKYMPKYSIPNRVHIFACTNFKTAVHLVPEDRRWLVPKVTEEKWPRVKWVSFFRWLRNGGLNFIAQWAIDYTKEHGPVEEGEESPMTAAKKDIIEDSMSEGMRLARDWARTMISKGDDKMVVVVSEVRRSVASRRGIEENSDKLEKESTLRKIMLGEGLHERPRTAIKEERMLVGRERTYVLANFPIHESAKWEDLKEHHKTPDDLAMM